MAAAIGLASLLLVVTGCESRTAPRLVVLAVFDTTRPDHLPAYGYARDTAPVVTALAREALVFERAIATAPWTVPSHASLFTGRMPRELDVGWHRRQLPTGNPTVAEHFRRAGYRTIAISQNRMLSRKTGFARGFEDWLDLKPGQSASELAALLDDVKQDRPIFVFLNLIAPHLPYAPPASERKRSPELLSERATFLSKQGWKSLLALNSEGSLSNEDLALLGQLYDGEIHAADQEFGQVLSVLGHAEGGRDAILLVTADHGENLGDHGLFDHQLGVFNTLLQVPLLIHAPGRLAPGRVAEPVSLVDAWRTLAELAGLPEADRVPGTSWLDAAAPRGPAVSEYERPRPILEQLALCCTRVEAGRYDRELVAARDARYTLWLDSTGRREFYDLERDPGEQHDLLASGAGAEARAALAHLEAVARRASTRAVRRNAPVPISDAERERLEALGYLSPAD